MFVPSLTAMIGFWATLSLNMPDFTRFGRSQREQIIGQVVALPTTMFVFAAMGVLITSATAIIYGEVIWDPIKLSGGSARRWSSPSRCSRPSSRRWRSTSRPTSCRRPTISPTRSRGSSGSRPAGLITGILGIVIQPWRLLADPSGYIFSWLLGYSGGLGSIAGVLIADYWIVRRTELFARGSLPADGPLRALELAGNRGHARSAAPPPGAA